MFGITLICGDQVVIGGEKSSHTALATFTMSVPQGEVHQPHQGLVWKGLHTRASCGRVFTPGPRAEGSSHQGLMRKGLHTWTSCGRVFTLGLMRKGLHTRPRAEGSSHLGLLQKGLHTRASYRRVFTPGPCAEESSHWTEDTTFEN